jgi:hypothetical protein
MMRADPAARPGRRHDCAYPAANHPASNAVCRKADFTAPGETAVSTRTSRSAFLMARPGSSAPQDAAS